MTLTPQEIVEILGHVRDSQCEEFHLSLGGESLSLRRRVDGAEALPAAPRPALKPHAAPVPEAKRDSRPDSRPATAAQSAAQPPPVAHGGGAAVKSGAVQVQALMGGVFYSRPSPEEPPFVELGTQVQAGDPVCVIEVMKLFSTVYAEVSGRIDGIFVEEAAAVEQGQLLFTIVPADG